MLNKKFIVLLLASSLLLLSQILYAEQITNGLRPEVWQIAMQVYHCAIKRGVAIKKPIITIIDYSMPSSKKRLWVIDLKKQQILFNTLVAHGKYSGILYPTHFSDKPGTLESSMGVFLTGTTYSGHDGYSLRIIGLDKGFNDLALYRHIIIHGAWYVSQAVVGKYGRVGRSWGCPALNEKWSTPIINTIKDGSLLLIYYPNQRWLTTSKFLHCPFASKLKHPAKPNGGTRKQIHEALCKTPTS